MNLNEIQSRLKALGLYNGKLDGIFGKNTNDAISAFFINKPYITKSYSDWPDERRTIAAGQLLCLLDGIEIGKIDGLIGPQTRFAFEVYDARKTGNKSVENWRDNELPLPKSVTVPESKLIWPSQRQADMIKFYGPMGANQAQMDIPTDYPFILAWEQGTTVHHFACHEKIHDAIKRTFDRVLNHYGPTLIRELGLHLFGGCLNVRKMRGSETQWSVHSWGAAVDIDPDHNQLKWHHDKARFAKPEYAQWFKFWSDEGFNSLGCIKDYDWMHVQAAQF